METKVEVGVERSVIMYHCPYCMKRMSHYRVVTDHHEYLTCRNCGRVLVFELANDAPNNNNNV